MMVGGNYHGGAIRASGVMETNGCRTPTAELGIGVVDSTVFKHNEPQTVASTLPWRHMAAGAEQTLGIKADGTLWGWGGNTYGEVGKGNTTLYSSPQKIGTTTTWTKVFAGWNSSFGIRADGKLYAWGDNSYGQLGDGSTTRRTAPVQVGSLAGYWVAVAPGYDHTLGLTSDGKLWAWGDNYFGELGDNAAEPSVLSPKQIGTLTNWIAIAAGAATSTGILADGSMLGWGNNTEGEGGDGTTAQRTGPTSIGWGVVQVCRTEYSAIGLSVGGQLLGWGYNGWGELGNACTTASCHRRRIPTTAGSSASRVSGAGQTASYIWNNAAASSAWATTARAPSASRRRALAPRTC